MTEPNWKGHLRALLSEADDRLDDQGTPFEWNVSLTDLEMQAFENMGLWNMEQAGWND